MDKRQKGILVWLMVWAGLLVAVLYSPVGSPDLYVPVGYNGANQGIDIAVVEFGNKPGISSSSSGGYTESMPTTSDLNSRLGGSVSSYVGGSTATNSGYGSFGASSGYGKGKAGGDMGGGALSSFSSGSSKKSESSSSSADGSISVFSSQATPMSGTIVRQGLGTPPTNGGTDPGGDPTGSTIPIGDGWIFLLVLLSAYTVYKKIRL